LSFVLLSVLQNSSVIIAMTMMQSAAAWNQTRDNRQLATAAELHQHHHQQQQQQALLQYKQTIATLQMDHATALQEQQTMANAVLTEQLKGQKEEANVELESALRREQQHHAK